MTDRKSVGKGLSAGTLIGLTIGGILALIIAMKPAFFASLL